MNPDTWSWRAELVGGLVMNEESTGTLGALPGHLVTAFSLVHISGSGMVRIDMKTGIAIISSPDGPRNIYPMQWITPLVKIPFFFRRNRRTTDGQASVEFRAVGFAVLGKEEPLMMAVRVFDDRIDAGYYGEWPAEQAVHTAAASLITGV